MVSDMLALYLIGLYLAYRVSFVSIRFCHWSGWTTRSRTGSFVVLHPRYWGGEGIICYSERFR